jgi:hypothetical protein
MNHQGAGTNPGIRDCRGVSSLHVSTRRGGIVSVIGGRKQPPSAVRRADIDNPREARRLMERVMRHLIAILALLALATPAAAQSTYIGGSAVFDIARFDKVEFDDDLRRLTGTATSADGEAVGFNGRIGRALGERWGLEFELARSGSIENRVSFGVPFFANFALLPPELAILPIPDFQYEIESEQRFMSYGTWRGCARMLGSASM